MGIEEIKQKYNFDESLVRLRDREKIKKYSTPANQKKAIERMKGDTSLGTVAEAATKSISLLNEIASKVVEAKNFLLKGGFAGSANSVLKLLDAINKERNVILKEEKLRRNQVKGTGWSTSGYSVNTK